MTLAHSNIKSQKYFLILTSLIGVCLSLYVFFIWNTISNTLSRQRSEKEIARLQTEVSELEFQYVSLTSSMTLEKAKSLGFIELQLSSVARNTDVALSR